MEAGKRGEQSKHTAADTEYSRASHKLTTTLQHIAVTQISPFTSPIATVLLAWSPMKETVRAAGKAVRVIYCICFRNTNIKSVCKDGCGPLEAPRPDSAPN
ncbi:UNVERIFIED_CONTAM: hypothetical protein FKN15_007815 [Acipenser sinensis]